MALGVVPIRPKDEVTVVPFLSRLYQDAEARLADRQIVAYNTGRPHHLYFSWREFLNKQYRGGRFGKAEVENVAQAILNICAMMHGVVGVSKDEFYSFFASGQFFGYSGDEYYIARLISHGYLREEVMAGVSVIFPTEKMLRRYRCGIPEDSMYPLGERVHIAGLLQGFSGRVEQCQLGVEVLGKYPGRTFEEALKEDGYVVLKMLEVTDGAVDVVWKRVFLFTGSRLVEVIWVEEAQWLGELLLKEERLPRGYPRNAFELYRQDMELSGGIATYGETSEGIVISSSC